MAITMSSDVESGGGGIIRSAIQNGENMETVGKMLVGEKTKWRCYNPLYRQFFANAALEILELFLLRSITNKLELNFHNCYQPWPKILHC